MLRSSSKLILKMNGENSNSSQETGFNTFAKSTKANQPSFHAVTTSTDTCNHLKPEVYYSPIAGQELTRMPVADEGHCMEVASCFLSSSLLLHKGLKRSYQINTIWRAVKASGPSSFAVCFQLQTAVQTPGKPASIWYCGLITSKA